MKTNSNESGIIYCCSCKKEVDARLTSGSEVYSHRKDLADLPFWKCDDCGNFVGCHHKTDHPTRPLGCIPSPEIKNARKHIHAILDPLWAKDRKKRTEIYKKIGKHIGYDFHTANIKTIEEARMIYRFIRNLNQGLVLSNV